MVSLTFEQGSRVKLSSQEEAVLSLSSTGFSDKEIAQRLGISIETVRTYWQRIKTKLGVATRAEAVVAITSQDAATLVKAHVSENKALIEEVGRRRIAEEMLHENRLCFTSICEASPTGIFITDQLGRCTYSNKACQDVCGLSELELLSKDWKDLIPSLREQRKALINVHRHNKYTATMVFQQPNGTERLSKISLTSVRSPDHIVGFVAMLEDITVVVKAKKELEETKRFVECIASATTDLVYVFDLPSQTTVYGNAMVESILGLSLDELNGLGEQIIEELIHPDNQEELLAVMASFPSLKDGEAAFMRYRIKTAAGDWQVVENRSVVLQRDTNNNVTQILGISKMVGSNISI